MTKPKNLGRIKLPNGKEMKFDGEANDVSDGYHTFGELYEHRIELFIALCKAVNHLRWPKDKSPVWKSDTHSDGSQIEGWFVLGLFEKIGEQITYHLPLKYWTRCDFARTLSQAPDFDRHSPQDVLQRVRELL